MILVYGGASSGKSAFAESLCQGENKIYLATMACKDYNQSRIDRHRRLRADKGFFTIEEPLFVDSRLEACRGKTVLLEDLSNLIANRMFDQNPLETDLTAEKIFLEIKSLNNVCQELIIVSNNIFDEGIDYDEGTEAFKRLLARTNCLLANSCQEFYEVALGIPTKII